MCSAHPRTGSVTSVSQDVSCYRDDTVTLQAERHNPGSLNSSSSVSSKISLLNRFTMNFIKKPECYKYN